MNLFCFASKNSENIWRGFAAGKWAVSTARESTNRGRATKARKHLRIGSYGLLYDSQTHSFTTPFVVESEADQSAVEREIWPEPWILPFSIHPLGTPERQLQADIARAIWPLFERRPWGRGGVTAAMNITGATVFSPVQIETDDWFVILRDLGDRKHIEANLERSRE